MKQNKLMPPEQALGVLCVTPEVINNILSQASSFEEVQQAVDEVKRLAKTNWRNLVKLHHPDHGGDASLFNTVQKAWETVKELHVVKKEPEPIIANVRFYSHTYCSYGSTATSSVYFYYSSF